MKIGSYTPVNNKVENIKIFTPVQTILIVPKYNTRVIASKFAYETATISITLQNSNTGNLTTIIPHVKLTTLGEISTFNEGVVVMDDDTIIFPIMLNPVGNVQVDNDKYLQLDLSELSPTISQVDIYTFTVGKSSDFIAKYSKMACPAGVARHKVNAVNNEILSLPLTGYDSVQLTYANGIVSVYSKVDLEYIQAQNNDLTAYKMGAMGIDVIGNLTNTSKYADFAGFNLDLKSGIIDIEGVVNLYTSKCRSYILNLENVKEIEIIRDSDSVKPLEYILGDFVPSDETIRNPQAIIGETEA